MANENEIGIEANLNQPAEQMEKLQRKINDVSKATQNLHRMLELLNDAKTGAVTTSNFDATLKMVLKEFKTLESLVRLQNPGATLAKATVDGMVTGFKSNLVSLNRVVQDGILSTMKDAEKVVKNTPIMQMLADRNKGVQSFVSKLGADPSADKRLELANRLRAAEMLLASAKATSDQRADNSLDKLIAKRERELTLLQRKAQLIAQSDADAARAARQEQAAEAAAQRRAQATLRQNAGLRLVDVIDQTTGVTRPAADQARLANLQRIFAVQQQLTGELSQQRKIAAELDRATVQYQERVAKTIRNSLFSAANIKPVDLINQMTGVTRTSAEQQEADAMRVRASKWADRLSKQYDAEVAAEKKVQEARLRQIEETERKATAVKEREAAKAAKAQAKEQERERRNSPEFLAASNSATAQRQQEMQRLRLFGDGGNFLLEIQARLMFNYKLLNSFMSAMGYGVRSVIEFDEALHQLQAISGSTKGEMADMKKVIVEVAEASRYTGAEVSKAAVLLAQAGLSTQQISAALKPISQLAQATGSDLKTATEVTTSVLGAFNYRAEETGNIVNIMTAALNTSKLDMEKLALGIQYAGNTAAQSNVSFSELTTLISALADTGTRSGSTLGTGITQLISDLINPTEKLKDVLSTVGLTMADVDIRTKGLTNVLTTMANAGFGASQALEGLELRAARAYLGIAGQIDSLERRNQMLLLGNSAAEASKVAMDSLAASGNRLASNFGIVADKMAAGLKPQIINVMNAVTELLQGFSGMAETVASFAVKIGGGAIFALLAVYLTRMLLVLGRVAIGLAGFGANLATATRAGYGFSAGMQVAAASTSNFARTLTLLKAAAGTILPLLAGFLVFEGISYVMSKNAEETNKFAKEMDGIKQKTNEANQANTKQIETQMAIDKAIADLLAKYKALNSNSESLATATLDLRMRFSDLGIELPKTVNNVNELIVALEKLRRISRDSQTLALGDKIASTKAQEEAWTKRFEELSQSENLDKFLMNDNKVGLLLQSKLSGKFMGPVPRDFSKGMTRYSLENTQGVIPEINNLMTSIGDKDGMQAARVAQLREAVAKLEKVRATGQMKLNPNDVMNIDENLTIARLLIKRGSEIAAASIEASSAGMQAKDAEISQNELIETSKEIFQSMDTIIQRTQVKMAGLRDDLKNADVTKQKGLGQDMRDQFGGTKSFIEEMFKDYLSTLDEDSRKAAEKAFKSGAGRKLSEIAGVLEGDIRESNELVDKQERTTLELEMNIVKSKIRDLEKRRKTMVEAGKLDKYTEEREQLAREEIAAQEKLNQKELDAQKGKLAEVQKRLLIQKQSEAANQIWETGQTSVEQAKIQDIDIKMQSQIDRAQQVVTTINSTINAHMSSMSGLLGKGMSAEAKARIFAQIEKLTEELINQQISILISSMIKAGKNMMDPENQEFVYKQAEQMRASATEENKRRFNSMTNNSMSAGNDALSREMRLLIAEITKDLKKLAQNFREIEKDLANANLEAENVQFKFDQGIKAYDAPVNRNSFSSNFKTVDQFEQSAEIENKVRAMRIKATEDTIKRQVSGAAEAEKLVQRLQQEKAALEGVAGANNASNSALSAVIVQLQSAEGEWEKYKQQLEGTTTALQKLKIEQDAQTQPKPKPTFFEQMNAGVKAWEINNRLYQDMLTQMAERVPQVLDLVSSNLGDAFMSIIDGTKSVGQAFGDMARSVIKSILQIIVQMLAMAAIKMALKFVGLGFSSGGEVPSGDAVGGGSGGGYGTYKSGGNVRYKRYAGGGAGARNRDSVPALLMPGEYVLRRAAARAVGRKALDQINAMGNSKVSEPMGAVGDFGNEMASQREAAKAAKPSGDQITNVWIVPPGEQPPPPTAKDIVAVITSDMMRGGQTSKLVKSIANGRG